MTRRIDLVLITLLLLLAAFVRINALSRLPIGFNDEEITYLRVAETARAGQVSVFYDIGNAGALDNAHYTGREVLFPALEALSTALSGDGLLCYRIVPMLAGLLSVALAYALGRRLFGTLEGLVAAGSLAIGLWPLLLSRAILPESLLLPIALAALLALTHAFYIVQHERIQVQSRSPRTAAFTALGFLVALAVYVHWIGLMLFPLVVVFIGYLWFTRQPVSRRAYGFSGYALLVVLILGIPYLTTTLRSPALSGFGALWLQRPMRVGALLVNARDVLISLTAGGGGLSVLALSVIGGLLLIGLGHILQQWRTSRAMLILLTLIVGALPAVWVGRGDFMLVLAFPAAALLIGVGASISIAWLRGTIDTAVSTARITPTAHTISIVLGGLTLIGLVSVLSVEFFNKWAVDPAINEQYHSELGHVAAYLDSLHDDEPTLICTDNLFGRDAQPVSDVALLSMMTHRRTINLRFSNCNSALILANGGQTQRIIFDNTNEHTPSLLSEWLTPAAQPVRLNGTRHTVLIEIQIEHALADAVGKLTLSHVEWAPGDGDMRAPLELPVRVGDWLHFEGYRLDAPHLYKPSEFVRLTTYWRIDGPQDSDLRVFAHVLADPDIEPVLQNDTLDVIPAYLRARDIVIQRSPIQLPYPFADGAYYLSVGAYHSLTKARIPVYDEAGQPHGDRLFLDTINVKG